MPLSTTASPASSSPSSPSTAAIRVVGSPRTLPCGGYLHHEREGAMLPPFILPEALDALRGGWDTDENDVFVCTHQKVGTHLTKKFVLEVMRALEEYPDENPLSTGDIGHHTVPWPEVMASQEGVESVARHRRATAGRDRLWYVHSSYEDLPVRTIHRRTRFVCVLRDPRGAAVSQYFFYKRHPLLQVPRDLDLSGFVDRFLEGDLYFGDYHRHVLGWLRRSDDRVADDQVLVLRYEDLVGRKLDAVRTLVEFLRPGTELSEERCAAIAASTDFDTMKRSITERPGSFHFNPATFFRAGTTRNWEQHLSPDDIQRIDRKISAFNKNRLRAVFEISPSLSFGAAMPS